jgi:hypothetical protein
MSANLRAKVRRMDREEIRFRAKAALRTRVRRAQSRLKPPVWNRSRLPLSAQAVPPSVKEALGRREWHAAHHALGHHFAHRHCVFPLDPRRISRIAARIREAFPLLDPTSRADRIVEGRYDLLGYCDVHAGSPPDWHRDPVHGRRAPLKFWNAIPYLDPRYGDHKITWELNRHQHFLALGRAYALTGDRRYYETFVLHLTDWIRANPPLLGPNWASMLELAFRCLSWIWALHFFAAAASDRDKHPWTVDLLLALDRQLGHVEENLSRYFSPNTHLTGEALGLYVAGRCLPELERAATRARLGREVLLNEVERQVLADGGHAELSTHYHRYSTDFYLLAFNVARLSGDPEAHRFKDAALRQARYLRAITDDRGRIPLIGDDDGGQLFPICGRRPWDCADTLATAAVLLDEPSLATGPVPEETYWLCGGVEIGDLADVPSRYHSANLAASGYCVSRNAKGDHLVFDCGRHGYLNGGHAHADALSITLTIAGRPFLIDSGTATYTMDRLARDRFRSSQMHNTVVVNGRTQSETDGPFHWRTRTNAEQLAWRSDPEMDFMVGQHSGFDPFIHRRGITAVHGAGWVIVDWIVGPSAASATAHWHIHPDWTLEHVAHGRATLMHVDGAKVVVLSSSPLQEANGLGEYAPEYGRIERGTCLAATVHGQGPISLRTVIAPADTLDRILSLASSVHS